MSEKIVSQLDSNDYFVDACYADESPLEPGVYLIPGGAVDYPPPVVPEGKRAKWNGNGFDFEKIPAPPPPDLEGTLAAINRAIQTKLDAGAYAWGYNGLVTAATYVTSANPQFSADAAALIQWRDDVWDWAIPKFADVTPGETPEEFMADMPPQPAQPKP